MSFAWTVSFAIIIERFEKKSHLQRSSFLDMPSPVKHLQSVPSSFDQPRSSLWSPCVILLIITPALLIRTSILERLLVRPWAQARTLGWLERSSWCKCTCKILKTDPLSSPLTERFCGFLWDRKPQTLVLVAASISSLAAWAFSRSLVMAIIMMAMKIQQFIMTMTTCKECAPLLLSKQDPMQSPFLISFDQMFILLWIINHQWYWWDRNRDVSGFNVGIFDTFDDERLTPTPTYASVGPSDHHHLAIHPGAALHLGHWSGNNHRQSEPAPLEPSFGVPSTPKLPQVSPRHHGSNSSPIKKKRVLFSGGSWISFYIYQLRLCSVYAEVRSEHGYIPPILHQFWSESIGL